MADPKGSKAVTTDGAAIHGKNAINVALENLTKEDRKAVKQELKKEMAELRKRKLACFQKMRNGIVKKADTATASGSKVNSHLSTEDFAPIVDISVASKRGEDLTQFTRVMAEDMRKTFDALKQDLSSSLPR
jgi:hypothetical protein